MKWFLLIAGESYYPARAEGDWIDTYESYQKALDQIEFTDDNMNPYKIGDSLFDWYEIVDLRRWVINR